MNAVVPESSISHHLPSNSWYGLFAIRLIFTIGETPLKLNKSAGVLTATYALSNAVEIMGRQLGELRAGGRQVRRRSCWKATENSVKLWAVSSSEILPTPVPYCSDWSDIEALPDILGELPQAATWKTATPITYGWSGDTKYHIVDTHGAHFLLRIAPIEMLAHKQFEQRVMRLFAEHGLPVQQVVDFGVCHAGVYQLLSWIDGEVLEEALDLLNPKQQYELGIKAGKALKAIHNIPVFDEDLPHRPLKQKKLYQLEKYEHSSLRVQGDEKILQFVRRNIDLLDKDKLTYLHGDYHIGNLVLQPDVSLGIIDCNRCKCTDRYDDFYKTELFDLEKSVPFAVGKFNGYFDGTPPKEFWQIEAVLVAHVALNSLIWAQSFGEVEVAEMLRRYNEVCAEWGNFELPIPLWYSGFDNSKVR
jgi:aminoglycoside phosphotransferase (APT) family kinase protein